MALTGTIFEAMASYYSNLAYESASLMRSLQEDIRAEQLDCKRMAAKTMSLWLDAAGGWWSALQLNAAPSIPTVFMNVKSGLSTHARTIKVLVPGSSAPEWTPLYSLDRKAPIAASHIQAEASQARDELTVRLRGLPDTIASGNYQGYVFVDEQPLAAMFLRIVASTPSQTDSPRARRGSKTNRRRRRA